MSLKEYFILSTQSKKNISLVNLNVWNISRKRTSTPSHSIKLSGTVALLTVTGFSLYLYDVVNLVSHKHTRHVLHKGKKFLSFDLVVNFADSPDQIR